MTDKTIRVSSETHEQLSEIGKYGESMDNILQKLIKFWKTEGGESE